MASSFDSLPQNASLASIYSQAGRIFAEQVINDQATDYTLAEMYNTAIWHIAQKALDRGFSALQGISKEQVASGIGNQIDAYRSRYRSVGTLSFDSLSQSASLASIYHQAGRMFEEQVSNDTGTDYTQAEAYNTALWHIAQKALERGFSVLQGMATQQVASGIGNHLSAYLQAREPNGVAYPIVSSVGVALGGAGVAPDRFWLPVVAMRAAELAQAYPMLTADTFVTAAGRVIGGETPTNAAKVVVTNATIGTVVEKPLAGWLRELKTHL